MLRRIMEKAEDDSGEVWFGHGDLDDVVEWWKADLKSRA
jgi:hypothetical protein